MVFYTFLFFLYITQRMIEDICTFSVILLSVFLAVYFCIFFKNKRAGVITGPPIYSVTFSLT